MELLVTSFEGDVYIDKLESEMEEGEAGEDGEAAVEQPRQRRRLQEQRMRDEFRALRSQNATLQREMEILKAQIERMSNRQERQFQILNNNVHRVRIQPAHVVQHHAAGAIVEGVAHDAGDEENPAPGNAASLSPLPKTIHALWHEYEFGIGGRKPARDFNATERGKNKHSYYRRKVVWDVIKNLVNAGWSANVACDRIYEIYGRNQPVTNIINRMLKDRKERGGHPNLIVNNL